jgi:hypothetical protein
MYSRRAFYVAFLVGLLTAFLVVLAVTVEFRDYDGAYTAFGLHFTMSILFLWMLCSRGSLRSKSPWIGISKMVGTACNSATFWLFTSGDSVLLPLLFASICSSTRALHTLRLPATGTREGWLCERSSGGVRWGLRCG